MIPAQAHALTQQRRRCSARHRVPQDTIDFVELTLSWEWSPEQISGVSHRIGMPVSHEWIYRYVAADKARGGKLYQRFRQGHKRDRNGSEQQALGDSQSALYRGSARRGRNPQAIRGLGG